jgi:antitoxin component of MazEF toxin-antitoxin module
VPKRVAEEAGLREKDSVEIEVRKGMLMVRPYLLRVYRLEDLFKRITASHVQDAVDFDGPVGQFRKRGVLVRWKRLERNFTKRDISY